MERRRTYERLRANPAGVRFRELCRAAELFGFELRRIRGSHHIYGRRGVPRLLNFQDVRGAAKPYQVRQFVRAVEEFGLLEKE